MNRRKTIALDLRMLGGDFGIGRYSLELAKKILESDPNHDYILFVRDQKDLTKNGIFPKDNHKVVLADFRHYSFQEQFNFTNLLNKYKPNLVHFFNFNVPILYNGPFVVTIHDMVHHRLPGNKQSRLLHRFAYKTVMSHAVKKSVAIITPSNFSKKEVLEFYDVPASKIRVIHEAAEMIGVTDSEVNAVKQRYVLNKPYILFIGVMERKKNILNLAKAFDILKDQFKLNIQLVLAGRADPHYPEILEEAQKIKYRKDLIVTGPVSDKEKFALLKGSLAFVSASKFEGFGLPGVEAMATGVPLVVSNIEVFNEVYDNGAIYFEPDEPMDIAQKIHFLLSDEKYKELITNNAYTRAQYFSWQRAANETIDTYNRILGVSQ